MEGPRQCVRTSKKKKKDISMGREKNKIIITRTYDCYLKIQDNPLMNLRSNKSSVRTRYKNQHTKETIGSLHTKP